MSGFFVVGEKKERPGVYKRYENAGGVEAAGARSGVGCALVTGNWGKIPQPALLLMLLCLQHSIRETEHLPLP